MEETQEAGCRYPERLKDRLLGDLALRQLTVVVRVEGGEAARVFVRPQMTIFVRPRNITPPKPRGMVVGGSDASPYLEPEHLGELRGRRQVTFPAPPARQLEQELRLV